ncbi:MAG: haloacid dehalogenase type II [Cytophagales bacterium]|nr:haloacid dehalogenase type II [Cytophagales bacterium]
MEKKYLVFDAYGTLLQVSSHISGLSDEQQKLSASIQSLWRTKQLEYTWLRSLMGKFTGFNQVTREALDYACNAYRMEDPELKRAILSIFEQPTAFDDAWRFLEQCKLKGFRTAILSNGEQDMLEQSVKIAQIDTYIDHILSASRVQVFKPSPKVYELATRAFSCEYTDIVFFSSNPWDVAGASNFGFQTIWLNRKDLPFEELGVKPWKVYSSFDEVSLEGLIK